jgi:hypothetical protein
MPEETVTANPEVLAESNASVTNSEAAKDETPVKSAETDAKEGEQEQGQGKGRLQERFSELTRKRKLAEQERDYWREQVLKTAKPENPAKTETAKEEPKARPEPKDFDLGDGTYDVAKYAEAVADWKVETRLAEAEKKRTEAQKQEQEKSSREKAIDTWRSKQGKAAQEAYDDYDEVIASAQVTVSPLMDEAIMASEFGGHLAYYFATHEDEASKIAQMSTYMAGKAIDKIEAQFAKDESADQEKPEEAPVLPVPKAPKPAPPSPVGKPSAAAKPFDAVRDADSMPYKEWVKKREAELRK